jgi:hypothetical protein
VIGANPTIVSYNASAVKIYNASAVKIYNATSSLVCSENKQFFFYFEKIAVAYYIAGAVVVNFKS